ncbi:MAG: DUF262 domain-containing protein [Gemmatimonadota bacterium]|nr:DUF262 domain-containing protein [Gemmatimonadota bacterium]
MEVKLRDLTRLFVHPAQYEIPRFQRPYVWTRDKQWVPLWDDVQHTAERILAAQREGSPPPQPHFMGAVVLQQIANVSGSLARRIVVDGQQRLTTLQLLLDAAQEVLERMGIDGPAARLEDLVLNQPKYQGGCADNAFKVWPTDADQEAFRHAMVNGLSGGGWSESRIVKAHEFFRDQIEQWVGEDEGPNEDANERAEALEKALSQQLELVVIDLRSSDNPHIIFETLNARGTPLRQSDLMKNMILHEAEKTGDGAGVPWPFEGAWWDQDIRQGRLYRPRIDVFLNYWLAMRTLQEVGVSDMFVAFRRHYERGEHGAIGDIAADIANVGSAYRRLETEELGGVWAAFAPRWKVMQAAVVTPVLLWLLSSEAEPGQVFRAIKALESYLVRRMVCRMTTRGYNRMFVDLVKRLEHTGSAKAGDTVIGFLGEREAYSTIWPNDKWVLDAISTKPLYRLLTRGRLRMVLEGVEEELRTTKSEGMGVPPELTIEHIMPRSWRGAWPGPETGLGPESPEERRDRLLDSLGNLTLVNQPLNSALSNGPWPSKRKGLAGHSTLFLNKDLLDHSQDRAWDEEAIRARAMRLHKLFVKAWPHSTDIGTGSEAA